MPKDDISPYIVCLPHSAQSLSGRTASSMILTLAMTSPSSSIPSTVMMTTFMVASSLFLAATAARSPSGGQATCDSLYHTRRGLNRQRET